tara:strand:- start:572 stop:1672 length:1101 start_codon:yes stop_codon:yes gene_type:complete
MKSNILIRTIILLSLILVLYGCAQPRSELPNYDSALSENEQKIQNQMFADSWIATYQSISEIGIDILFQASDLCINEDKMYGLGIDVATHYDAPESIRDEINKTLNLNENLKIVSLGKISPGSKAGLQIGDEIIKIDNLPAPSGETANLEYYKILKNMKKGEYNLTINRNGKDINVSIATEERCRFNYGIDLDNNNFNAFADGNNIILSLRMAKWLIQDEIGAAIVFAHEFAHNANHHIDDKKKNANTGAALGLLVDILIGSKGYGYGNDFMELGANIGANQYSIQYENEADYLSMYALALSGYDITKAPNFWRRFAVEVPNSIYSGGSSHPTTSERYLRLETYIKEIKSKIDNGVKPMPTYKIND